MADSESLNRRQRTVIQLHLLERTTAYDTDIGPIMDSSDPEFNFINNFFLTFDRGLPYTSYLKPFQQLVLSFYLDEHRTILRQTKSWRIGKAMKKNGVYAIPFKLDQNRIGQILLEQQEDKNQFFIVAFELSGPKK